MTIWKRCPSCRVVLPVLAFCIARATRDGRYFECRQCKKLRAFGKPRKQRTKKYPYVRTAEKDAYKKAWREANRDRVRASNAASAAKDPVKTRRQKAEHAKRNPGATNAKTAAYRSKKKQAHAAWANPEKIAQLYALAAASTRILGIPFAVDHIVPLQSKIVCGLHVEKNLRVIPKSENSKKGNRHWPDMP